LCLVCITNAAKDTFYAKITLGTTIKNKTEHHGRFSGNTPRFSGTDSKTKGWKIVKKEKVWRLLSQDLGYNFKILNGGRCAEIDLKNDNMYGVRYHFYTDKTELRGSIKFLRTEQKSEKLAIGPLMDKKMDQGLNWLKNNVINAETTTTSKAKPMRKKNKTTSQKNKGKKTGGFCQYFKNIFGGKSAKKSRTPKRKSVVHPAKKSRTPKRKSVGPWMDNKVDEFCSFVDRKVLCREASTSKAQA